MIVITDAAKKYILEKKIDALTIEYPAPERTCCGIFTPAAEVYNKIPEDNSEYNLHNIEGIDVYISKIIVIPSTTVTIDLDTLFGLKKISVKGIPMKYDDLVQKIRY